MKSDFRDEAGQIIASMPRLYLACPIPFFPATVEQLAAERFATVIRSPLKSNDALAAVQRQLELLSAEAPPVQLFLPRIKVLRISADPSKAAIVLERNCKVLKQWDGTRLLKAHCGTRSFIVAEKTIPHSTMLEVIRRDIAVEALPAAWEEWTGDAVVSVAVAKSGDPLEPRLYNFLPMGEAAEAPFAGYLDAPFFATLDRLRVQEGVEVNKFLWESAGNWPWTLRHARELACRAVRRDRWCLISYCGAKTTVRCANVCSSQLSRSSQRYEFPGISKEWGTLGQARIWQGDAFLSPHLVARYAGFPIVDPELDLKRMRSLRSFVEGTGLLNCPATERAEIVEHVAKGLPRAPCDINQWNQFYRSLAELFRNDASVLAGRRLLLTAGDERPRRHHPRRLASWPRNQDAAASLAYRVPRIPPGTCAPSARRRCAPQRRPGGVWGQRRQHGASSPLSASSSRLKQTKTMPSAC